MRYLMPIVIAGLLAACSDEPAPTGDEPAGVGGNQGGVGGNQGGVGGNQGGAGGAFGNAAGGAGGACVDNLPVSEAVPDTLSGTGLYADIADQSIAAFVRSFTPQYVLWSDDASKRRWIYLPECDGVIDASDMNAWSFPVGTRLWKEFSVEGARIETRFIQRTGPGPDDWMFTTYLWNTNETQATRLTDGQVDALGTTFDVPSEATCRRCHGSHAKGGGRPSRALGFSALQLAHDDPSGVTLTRLVADAQLSDAPAVSTFGAPGDAVESAALGYLHVNCGSCHNSTRDRVPQIDLDLWLDVGTTDVTQTPAYLTTVGVPNTLFNVPSVTARIEPGSFQQSSVWFRMNERGNNAQMPAVGTEVVDAVGNAALQTWIANLP